MKTSLFAAVASCALLAGCGGSDSRGGLSAEEERQLDDAAKMLEDNMIDVSPDSLTANEAELDAIDANTTGANESPEGNGL
ncbi:MAG TPA: hypothetical protein VF704_04370 [Allosphingosinicella sp.]|jgi:outer membrane murein-binding lipoprotein Lpp